MLHKFRQRNLGCYYFASSKHSGIIVLSRLCHQRCFPCNLSKTHIFRIIIQNSVSDSGKFSQIISEYLAVCCRSKPVILKEKPLASGRWNISHANQAVIEITDSENPYSFLCLCRSEAGNSHISLGQFIICFLQFFPDLIIGLIGQPHTKARSKIMISRHLIIKAKAFRSLSHKADGNQRLVSRKPGTNHGHTKFLIKCLAEFQTVPKSFFL